MAMAEIREIIRQTRNRFLNMYEFRGTNKLGHPFRYFMASRAEREEDLKAVYGGNRPDGVIIYGIYRGSEEKGPAGGGGAGDPSGGKQSAGAQLPGSAGGCPAGDQVVLVREYRLPIGAYVYGFPAGLVDKGESFREAGVREMHEETGLAFAPLAVDPMFEEPRFTSSGLTDESCAMVYGYATGTPSRKFLEEGEDIQIVLADREEARRILREERVALMCAYHLMHFIADEDPFAFLRA